MRFGRSCTPNMPGRSTHTLFFRNIAWPHTSLELAPHVCIQLIRVIYNLRPQRAHTTFVVLVMTTAAIMSSTGVAVVEVRAYSSSGAWRLCRPDTKHHVASRVLTEPFLVRTPTRSHVAGRHVCQARHHSCKCPKRARFATYHDASAGCQLIKEGVCHVREPFSLQPLQGLPQTRQCSRCRRLNSRTHIWSFPLHG